MHDAQATDPQEMARVEGSKAAYIEMLRFAAERLGHDDPLAKAAALIAEREEAIQTLREICAQHGDNDWPDELSLGEILWEHLEPHL